MFTITPEVRADVPAREALLDRAFGKRRHAKTAERLREGRLPSPGLAFTARNGKGRLIGTIRLWDIAAGSAGPALLLGPVAVECRHQGKGIGAALMRYAIDEAHRLGHRAVILVGDAPYYGRFGFSREPVKDLHLPGPVERERFLGLELIPGALADAAGIVTPAGHPEAPASRTRAA
jgi:predicted N-acetyltransferase YhbS